MGVVNCGGEIVVDIGGGYDLNVVGCGGCVGGIVC